MIRPRYGRRTLIVLLLGSLSALFGAVWSVRAQDDLDMGLADVMRAQGYDGTGAELEAWELCESGRFVLAREDAEAILRHHPNSFVAHLVLGNVEHYAEADFPRALFQLDTALAEFEARYGRRPAPPAPWRWHSRLLRELALVHGDLEDYAERLNYITRYNELYDPDMLADRAWPLMKLGRFADARRAARAGIASGEAIQRTIGLNAICAIEFEAGNDGASYEGCRQAMDEASRNPAGPDAVDYLNFAEASRSVFKLDEAERVSMDALHAEVAWYGNPWSDSAELYVRTGRFVEALAALKQVPRYRQERPPHVRDADRNETRRVLAQFFIVVGRPDDALRITEKALVAPDRRGQSSRDPTQDLLVTALLDREADRLAAASLREDAVGRSFWTRVQAWAHAVSRESDAWAVGREAARQMIDDRRLVGAFRIGTSTAAIMPPWLAGDLVDVLGAGVVREAVRRARVRDHRPGAGAYYDAFEAEAALAEGDDAHALELAGRADRGLGVSEELLRARAQTIGAAAASSLDQSRRASELFEQAMMRDPGVLRRLDIELPVRLLGDSSALGAQIADVVEDSPRFVVDERSLLSVRVRAHGANGGEACLVGASGLPLACGTATRSRGESDDDLVARVVRDLQHNAFAPRVDMSQSDASSLDGSNGVTRDPLGDMLHAGDSGLDGLPE